MDSPAGHATTTPRLTCGHVLRGQLQLHAGKLRLPLGALALPLRLGGPLAQEKGVQLGTLGLKCTMVTWVLGLRGCTWH